MTIISLVLKKTGLIGNINHNTLNIQLEHRVKLDFYNDPTHCLRYPGRNMLRAGSVGCQQPNCMALLWKDSHVKQSQILYFIH